MIVEAPFLWACMECLSLAGVLLIREYTFSLHVYLWGMCVWPVLIRNVCLACAYGECVFGLYL